MDFAEITTVISTVGFPIVMCLLMYKYITTDSKQTREAMASLEKAITALETVIENFIKRSDEA